MSSSDNKAWINELVTGEFVNRPRSELGHGDNQKVTYVVTEHTRKMEKVTSYGCYGCDLKFGSNSDAQTHHGQTHREG